MADKIFNLNDYRREDTSPKMNDRPRKTDADEIHIEDPMNFLNSDEKQEYIRAHQETILNSGAVEEVQRQLRMQEQYEDNQYIEDQYDDGQYDEDQYDDGQYDEGQYDEGKYEDDYQEYMEENSDDGNDRMAVITKVLAVITASLILIMIGLFVFNTFFNDPAHEEEAGDEFAYTEENEIIGSDDGQSPGSGEVSGTTVHTTSGLNLRTSPGKKDDNVAMSVAEGTELIMVGEEEGWAKVYYQGAYYYCSKSYLK